MGDCAHPCNGRCRWVGRQGVIYRCARALADELGVTVGAVYQSLHKHGDAEHVGTRKGVPVGGLGNHRKPVKVGPHQWPSVSHMARDLGVDRTMLGKKLRRQPEAVLALVMRAKG